VENQYETLIYSVVWGRTISMRGDKSLRFIGTDESFRFIEVLLEPTDYLVRSYGGFWFMRWFVGGGN
jgi:hypothetical protein